LTFDRFEDRGLGRIELEGRDRNGSPRQRDDERMGKVYERIDGRLRTFIEAQHIFFTATAPLSGDRWPGTTGLYFAEVELEAPAEEGLYTWSVKCAESDDGIPHDEGSVDFGVRVVGRPEYVVKVETVDKESRIPLSGARVVMHPYRAVTNERGIAEVWVVKGAYKLFVSQTSYITFGLPVEVTADMTARVELDLEPVTERN